MTVLPIDTPAVLVDLDIAEKNIRDFQHYCDQHNLRLRPHIKTHKLPAPVRKSVRLKPWRGEVR